MPVIDVWAVVADPVIPDGVVERLIDRRAAVRAGRTPDPVPEDDKPWLSRHIFDASPAPGVSGGVGGVGGDAPARPLEAAESVS